MAVYTRTVWMVALAAVLNAGILRLSYALTPPGQDVPCGSDRSVGQYLECTCGVPLSGPGGRLVRRPLWPAAGQGPGLAVNPATFGRLDVADLLERGRTSDGPATPRTLISLHLRLTI